MIAIFYFILSIIMGRKNPLMYLIFPIALMAGPGMFVDSRTAGSLSFLIQGNVSKDIASLYLLLIATYCAHKYRVKFLFPSPMLYYFYYILFVVLITIVNYSFAYDGFNEMRLWLEMMIGFFSLRAIFLSANTKQWTKFFSFLQLLTCILSVCYVINSSGTFKIFDETLLYQDDLSYGNAELIRDFRTIPLFSSFFFLLSLSCLLSKSHFLNKRLVYFSLLSYPFVLLFTYTRSMLFTTIAEAGVIMLFLGMKNGVKSIGKYVWILILGVAAILVMQTYFGDSLGYFTERLSGLQGPGGATEDQNVDVRMLDHLGAFNIVNQNNGFLFGVGMNRQFFNQMDMIGAWAADTSVPYLLLTTGWIGVLFYYITGFMYGIKSAMAFKHNGQELFLVLAVILVFDYASKIFMGGTSWGNPLVFIYLAFAECFLVRYHQFKNYNSQINKS